MIDQVSLEQIPKNMRRSGMLLFAEALMEALQDKSRMCVVHAAHAAEILLKARIAQEHPLLIFSKLPKPDNSKNALTLMDLLESGRTFSYEELPDQLWAATGIKIDCLDQYRKFGRLRNQIIHFSMATTTNPDTETIKYAFDFLDPLVESFWGKSVVEFIARNPSFCDDFTSGILEDKIRDQYGMNDRLRRCLGESSRQAWEKMQNYLREQTQIDQFLYQRYEIMSSEEIEEELIHDEFEIEKHEQYDQSVKEWNIFLESF